MDIKKLTVWIAFGLFSCSGGDQANTTTTGDRLNQRKVEKEVLFGSDCQYSRAVFFIADTNFGWEYYTSSGDVLIRESYNLELFNKEIIKLISPAEINELGFYNFWIEKESCDCVEIMLSIVEEDTDHGYNPLIRVCGKEAKYLREI